MLASRMMQPAFDYDALTGEIQHTLAAIADVEFAFQIDRERLEGSPKSEVEKARYLVQLEQIRQERRAPLAQRLAELYEHARFLVGGTAVWGRGSRTEAA